MPPALVTKEDENEIFRRMYSLEKFNLWKPVFKVGDRVHTSQNKETFGNKYEYDQNWTTEILYVDTLILSPTLLCYAWHVYDIHA